MNEYYPDEIAEAIIAAAYNPNEEKPNKDELTEALYQLKAMAQNPYSSDYWRELYAALENLALYYPERI